MDSKKVKENYMDEMMTKPKWKYVNEFGEESELRRRHYINNENNCKKRKKHRGPEDDDKYFNIEKDDKEEILPKWKIFVVGAAIFLCFAILYPSVFGPLIGSLFGNKGGDHSAQNQRNIHPSMMGAHPKQRDVRSGHPHPISPQMVHQGQGGGGGRRGFAWLLPFYTIGVVCFLLYTLFKIMFKSKKKKKLKKSGQRKTTWDEDEEEDSDEDRIQGVRGQKLHSVQARLRKTEHAMHEILHQLELIANQAEQFRQPLPKEDDPNQTNENQSNMEKQGTDGGLTGEQTTQMEMRLKELKMLSEMVKRDHLLRSRLREHSSTELSDEEDEMVEDDLQNNEEIDSQTDEESELEEEEEGPRKTNI